MPTEGRLSPAAIVTLATLLFIAVWLAEAQDVTP
jgi:hypothetical protein